MSLLSVKNLTIRFGGLVAVDNLSFEMEPGKITSLIGPNGAGKTTVINMLTGFYTPTAGHIVLYEKDEKGNEVPVDITGNSTDLVVKKGLSRTFQNIRLFSNMTALDNILVGMQHRIEYGSFLSMFPNAQKNKCEKQAKEEAMEILKKVGLEDAAYERATSLPYGMQRKLEIGRALASHPKVLLLDEPAAGMNPAEKKELSQFIRSLLNEVEGILLIEHDMKLIMDISDKIVVLNHGAKICEGKPEEVQTNEEVIEAYLGKKGVQRNVTAG
ncbi:MAG: ABC transporter ATP-binding protein [Erysipelotrichaceae bacterium]|nr:ABC transporter ATP-binding protein [Erysipelotrichaceae bacterium]